MTVHSPSDQFMVEHLKGFFAPSDIVRLDNGTISRWQKLSGDKRIREVEIEAFNGEVIRSKLEPQKNAEYEGKGVIQMPEKLQRALGTKKGELVKVKPVVC